MTLHKKLTEVQNELKAPKSQYNSFGKYNYRNQEDILEAVKPLLKKYDLDLTISDEIVLIGTRYYVRAEAILSHHEEGQSVSVTAFAREEEDKRGMDASQITGSASSYARKYALNGLFLIDDTKDADSHDNTPKPTSKPTVEPIKAPATDTSQQTVMVAKCSDCSTSIATNVAVFSKQKFGRLLCMKCQAKEKEYRESVLEEIHKEDYND